MNWNSFIDHTLLRPEAQNTDILKICREAKQWGFFSVCIHPSFVSLAKKELQGSSVKICTVIGFPFGAQTQSSKVFESTEAIDLGADELDMVLSIGKLKSCEYDYVEEEIQKIIQEARGRIVKVILETSLLTNEEKKIASEISMKAGAHFVKTSTGFAGGGATVEDIVNMRKWVGPSKGVKASGGIRDRESFEAMIKAGANRIGTSAGVQIMQGLVSQGEY